jgi:GrpB-like predicted nucleotidyltransferase (UPF0157 family)
MKIHLPEDYQPLAHRVFDEVYAELHPLLPSAKIAHVGSSSIPGAISKGDIDICVAVPAAEFDVTLATLEAQGYKIKADTLRTPQLCMLDASRVDISLAIQLIEKDSAFEFFHKFRDALIDDPDLLAQYNALKLRFADQGADVYRDEKAKFISAVLAESTGKQVNS